MMIFQENKGLRGIWLKIPPQAIRTWVEEYFIEKSVWREFLDFS